LASVLLAACSGPSLPAPKDVAECQPGAISLSITDDRPVEQERCTVTWSKVLDA
jgi:hypothetical protein